jgi:outer membrane protein assembly factor BamB
MKEMRGMIGLLLVSVSLLAGCEPTVYQEGAMDILQGKVLSKVDLRMYWERTIPLPTGEQVDRTWILGDKFYCLTDGDTLICVDARVGTTLWSQELTVGQEQVFAPVHVDDMRLPLKVGNLQTIDTPPSMASFPQFNAVVISTTTRLWVIDRDKGTLYRNIVSDGFTPQVQGVCDTERFYTVNSRRQVCGVKLLQGLPFWQKSIKQELIKAPLAMAPGYVLAATMDGTVQCYIADDLGTETWRKKLNGGVRESLVADERGVFLAADDRMIYGLTASRGRPLWDPVSMVSDPEGPMLLGEQTLFQYAGAQGGLYAVDIANGQLRWRAPKAKTVLAIIDQKVYLKDRSSTLQVRDEMTGKVLHTISLADFELYPNNVNTPAIYMASRNGRIACLRHVSQGPITMEELTSD